MTSKIIWNKASDSKPKISGDYLTFYIGDKEVEVSYYDAIHDKWKDEMGHQFWPNYWANFPDFPNS
mgnify:CR=1